eukprot:TRINITY_DN74801_c0_g1_i1.p1 TRINITY_DN74801_c0_g1~~TRINITY_DN74801_c0_g1_i1.p1  ORF type:complete len:446 (-),score=102.46 TRINITY_DN74801_c0_g1_i1:14-1315(-)
MAAAVVAEAALEAWADCQPDGYILREDRLQHVLPYIAAKIPGRKAVDLEKLFTSPDKDQPAIFQQMLRAQDGNIHFLYFWKAFGWAAQTAGADQSVPQGSENLSSELDLLRDRILRRAEEAGGGSSCSSSSGSSFSPAVAPGSTEAPAPAAVATAADVPGAAGSGYAGSSSSGSCFSPVVSLDSIALIEEVDRAASMSAYPQFWRAAASSLKSQLEVDKLSLGEVTSILLSWLQDATVWEAEQQANSAPVQEVESKQKKEPDADARQSFLPVRVHVYDVSQEESIQKINRILAHKSSPLKLGGVFHAGVEVNGLEWSFGFSASETHPGVSCVEPKTHPQHHYRQTVNMGKTKATAEDIADIIHNLLEEYPGDDYDLLRRNCCHFADDMCRRLGVGGIPSWVIRLARIGAGVDSMLQYAPKGIKERIYGPEDSD